MSYKPVKAALNDHEVLPRNRAYATTEGFRLPVDSTDNRLHLTCQRISAVLRNMIKLEELTVSVHYNWNFTSTGSVNGYSTQHSILICRAHYSGSTLAPNDTSEEPEASSSDRILDALQKLAVRSDLGKS
ncbi:hypothetical protein NM688_g4333 [Phlebia brevispora]|uniref:Uncharacterized protein n=1 Tax=Phlebia brevispora TaxID=194682 RepID=A0ACC1T3E6_9APHY|nr:hypothetical protein NM688_g4333 [Phlebia brevispora]